VVLHTDTRTAVMKEIAPLLLHRSTHRQNMIGPDEPTRDGIMLGKRRHLNQHTDSVSRHFDTKTLMLLLSMQKSYSYAKLLIQ
jgi:hypothetical protein